MARTAIVTGGASGIGRALGGALAQRGVRVVLADVDGEGAARAAADLEGPGEVTGATLDVSDPDAVAALIEDLHGAEGRLDYLFNNAGIGVGGLVEELTLAHWDRAIDVNLRGVVHGVHAAYPIMLAQGNGHIVNTASLSGLVPTPRGTPYAMTKHAVVGLSVSLRIEAAVHGVRVSCVCPGVVETPLLDATGPADLPVPPSYRLGSREALVRATGRPYPAERFADDVLRGVDRNQALIVAPRRARVAWRAQRLVPRVVAWQVGRVAAEEGRRLAADGVGE